LDEHPNPWMKYITRQFILQEGWFKATGVTDK